MAPAGRGAFNRGGGVRTAERTPGSREAAGRPYQRIVSLRLLRSESGGKTFLRRMKMTSRALTAAVLCTIGLSILAVPGAIAGPNGHANGHAQSDNGGGNGNGNGNGGGNGNGNGHDDAGSAPSTPHSIVRQYAIANGLKQGDVAKSLKSWNSLNANPKAFLNNLDNPNSRLGREAKYICDNAGSQTALASFTDLGGNPDNPPTAQEAADAQALLDAFDVLGTDDPATVAGDPTSYSADEVDAANLVLGSSLDKEGAQAVVDQFEAWTAAQNSAQQATDSFVAATGGHRSAGDLADLRKTVDGIIAQKNLDTSDLCGTSVAAK